MRRVVFLLVACAIVIGAALWIALLPGAARFEAGDLSIDAATPTLVFAAIFFLLLLYAVVRALAALIRLPRRMRARRTARRRRDGDAAVTRSLVALAADHQSDALAESARARKLLGDTPQTLLIAAQAHRLAGRHDDADAHFTTLADHPDAALIGLRGLLHRAIERQDWAEARTLADRAERAYPNSAWLREERQKLAVHAGDWKGALTLAGPGAPRQAYAAAAAAGATDPAEGLKLARDAFRADAAFTPSALAYARRLRGTGSEKKALVVLQEAWNANPHPDIAEAALAPADTGAARLHAAQRLTATTKDHPESQFLLARAALDAGDLAAAREAADGLKARLDQRRVWALVAEIEDRIHHDSAAVRAAWQKAAVAAPDPTWRCTACSHRQPHWSATCVQCGRPGALVWN